MLEYFVKFEFFVVLTTRRIILLMNMKKHYKLYKSGKLWVTAAIATLALTTGMAVTTTNASANDQPAVRESSTNASDSASDSTTTPSASGSEHGQTSEQPSSGADHGQQPAEDKGTQETHTVTVTRQVTFVTTDEKGNKTSTTSSQTAKFTRTDTVFKDTTKNKPGKWQANAGNKDQLVIPAESIKVPKDYYAVLNNQVVTEIPALPLTADELDKAVKQGSIKEKPITINLAPANQTITPTNDNKKSLVWDSPSLLTTQLINKLFGRLLPGPLTLLASKVVIQWLKLRQFGLIELFM